MATGNGRIFAYFLARFRFVREVLIGYGNNVRGGQPLRQRQGRDSFLRGNDQPGFAVDDSTCQPIITVDISKDSCNDSVGK